MLDEQENEYNERKAKMEEDLQVLTTKNNLLTSVNDQHPLEQFKDLISESEDTFDLKTKRKEKEDWDVKI